MASAMLDDVFGWLAFSIVLGMSGVEVGATGACGALLGIAVFSFVLFVLVRPILGRVVPWSQRRPESAVSVLAPNWLANRVAALEPKQDSGFHA